MAYSQFYPARTYSLSDGMPANSIYDITQAPDGVMWFLSSKGIFTYNSAEWYLFPDSLNLPSSEDSRLLLGEDSTIWVAGRHTKDLEIRYYKNNEWNKFELPVEINPINHFFAFSVIKSKSRNKILIGHYNKLYTIDIQSKDFKTYELENENFIYDILCDNINDQVLLSTKYGLYELSDSVKALEEINAQIPDLRTLAITKHKDEVYILGSDWIGKTSSDDFDIIVNDIELSRTIQIKKHNLTIDPSGRIFFSSSTPAKYFDSDNNTIHTLFVDGRYLNVLCNKIFIDRENNVWVGDHRGLFKFNLLRFLNYNKNTQLAADEVSTIYELKDKYILANPEHLNFISKDKLLYTLSLPSGEYVRVLDLIEDNNTIYVAASHGGLLKISGKRITKINTKSKDGVVTSLVEFDNNILYSSYEGIFNVNGEKYFKTKYIRNLQLYTKDTLALSKTDGGLTLLSKDKTALSFKSKTNQKLNNVYSVIKWRNRLILATKGGIATVKSDEIIPFKELEELKLISAYCFTVDEMDRLWIGSNEGVFIWDGSELIQYTRQDGLVGNEVNRNALITDNKGRIWIGTELGASVYELKEDVSFEIKPTLRINKVITQKGSIISNGDNLTYDNNTLEFNFLGISFYNENQITYRYKLEGFDEQWNYSDKNGRDVKYTNLPSGEYSFTVQAGIDNDNWSRAESFDLIIDKPIYRKTWFILLAVLLALVILYIIYRIRFYMILRNQQRLKALVEARTREIARKNTEIEAQNSELKQKSDEITAINEQLEESVKQRTEKIIVQNKRMMKYAFINSHKLRAPICRLLGLINLLEKVDTEERKYIVTQLKNSSIELDEISTEINHLLEEIVPEDDQ